MSFFNILISLLLFLNVAFVSPADTVNKDFNLPLVGSETLETVKSNVYVDISYDDIYKDKYITCFDISDDGKYLLLYSNIDIAVYDENFVFLYCITIRDHNSSPTYRDCVYWNDNGNIMVLSYRSGIIIEIDEYGNIANMYNYNAADKNTQKQIRDYCRESIRYYNNTTYSVISSELSTVDSNGNKTILHESEINGIIDAKIILIEIILGILLISTIITFLYRITSNILEKCRSKK